jgi:hypothetical protein
MGALLPLRIGSRVNNSNAQGVLFVGHNNQLAEDSVRLTWNPMTHTFQISGTLTLVDGTNIVLGSSSGTIIGTSASQKQSWFGAAPVVQQSGATKTAASIYGVNEQQMLQTLYAALRTYGGLN